MRRAILFSFSLIWGAFLCATAGDVSSSTKTDAQMHGFRGPVRSVHTEMVVPSEPPGPGQTKGDPFTQDDLSFDREGWLTEWVSYVAGEEMMHEVYQREGPIVLHKETTYSGPRNRAPRKEVQTNDKQGRPTEFLIYSLDGRLKERTVYQYETGGTRRIGYDGSGKLLNDEFRTEKVQSSNGTATKETFVDGKLKSRATSETAADASRTKSVYYSNAGGVTLSKIEETGNAGESSAIVFGNGSTIAGTKDAAGNLVQIREESNGRRMVTTSNANGRKIEYYDADGKLRTTLTTNYSENDRDEHGNWIRLTQYVARPNSEPKVNSVTTRKITYYE